MSPPTTVGLLMTQNVLDEKGDVFRAGQHGLRLAHDIPGRNETGHEKVWTAVVGRPMSILTL